MSTQGRRPSANVVSIPPGAPFLPSLLDALYDGRLVQGFKPDPADPLGLSTLTIYLPTRRAARALAALIAEQAQVPALLMPRIVPLGDVDAAEFAIGAGEDEALQDATLLPAIPDTERRLILTQLVLAWASRLPEAMLQRPGHGPEPLLVPASPADAYALAGHLAALMDDLGTRSVDWVDLKSAAESRFDRYYAITTDFLEIAAKAWPGILAERGASDPALRRDRLIRAEAERLTRDGAPGPVIAAGSTGSVPATARLLAAISRLPNGIVVLPGLDRHLDIASLNAILSADDEDEPAHGHPQAMLTRLVNELGVLPEAVDELAAPASEALDHRARLVSDALRPAQTTDLWSDPARRMPVQHITVALHGVTMIDARDEREEALAVAIALRETIENSSRTAALITPDRVLAQRVCAELKRWDIDAEDSAGRPLTRCSAGTFARLVADAAAFDLAPVPLLAMLSHPAARFDFSTEIMARARAALEIGTLRGPLPPPGLDGLLRALDLRRSETRDNRHAPGPLKRLSDSDWDLARTLLERVGQCLEGLTANADSPRDLTDLMAAHRDATTRASTDDTGHVSAFSDANGEALAGLFDDISCCEAGDIALKLKNYPALFNAMAGERVVAQGGGGHRRVKIWGLLEARLLSADRVIVGGLDETVWPPVASGDAFLNRPMREALGLALPERRIGQTAHDFAQALGNHDVIIARAAKREGKPTVPSRLIQRLRAYCGPAWDAVTARGDTYLAWAREIDEEPPWPPLPRPEPKPHNSIQPIGLSVTDAEKLVRDPYAIYARHILKLDPIDALASTPGAAERGQIIHAALAAYSRDWRDEPLSESLKRLIAAGREAFAGLKDYPDVEALWWPRFERVANAFVRWEAERRPNIAFAAFETRGKLTIALAGGKDFTLTCFADRIEIDSAGAATIIDFKTGTLPTRAEMMAGFSGQLPLEAAILQRDGFDQVPAQRGPVELVPIKIGQRSNPVAASPIKPHKDDRMPLEELPGRHLERVKTLIELLRAGERGFVSRPFPQHASRFGPYDHLARVKEWSAVGGERGEDNG